MNIKKQVDATLELPANKTLNVTEKAVVKWTEGESKLTIHQGDDRVYLDKSQLSLLLDLGSTIMNDLSPQVKAKQ